MAVCPLCQSEFDMAQSGQLGPKCRDEILAKDAASAKQSGDSAEVKTADSSAEPAQGDPKPDTAAHS